MSIRLSFDNENNDWHEFFYLLFIARSIKKTQKEYQNVISRITRRYKNHITI